MEWLTSLAPVLSPLFGMTGVLGGGWLVYRQNTKKNKADAEIAEGQTFVSSMKTVTEGFTSLLEQQRSVNESTMARVTTLEERQVDLERKVERLEEEQRQWRRWKAAALEYIRDLRDLVAKTLGRAAPAPPEEIEADVDAQDRD
ncbi:hypothetical protein C6N75_12650 [Streptomyces solincola]|uniref:Uncharacterized protein n=1 Tax=Streptomyces solincola TaxID=2100817 RepID=A0A2S9PWR6_9ACTN|nr:hypothetical protein [Streptomyces solincola]PRH78849.1 hypothetical protein C6N75_12650 [Streptomyces solincola]